MSSTSICKTLQSHYSMKDNLQLQLRNRNKHSDDNSYPEPNPNSLSDPRSMSRNVANPIGDGWSSLTSSIYPPFDGVGNGSPFIAKECSFTRLSQRSLDMCTEVLGSETGMGGNLADDLDITAITATRTQGRCSDPLPHSPPLSPLPPPLRSLAGDGAFRVTQSRENGRFVLRATFWPRPSIFLLSQRMDTTDGSRLCIRSFPGCNPACFGGKKWEEEEEEEEESEEERKEEKVVVEMDEYQRRLCRGCNKEDAVAGNGGGGRCGTAVRCH